MEGNREEGREMGLKWHREYGRTVKDSSDAHETPYLRRRLCTEEASASNSSDGNASMDGNTSHWCLAVATTPGLRSSALPTQWRGIGQ